LTRRDSGSTALGPPTRGLKRLRAAQ
jgi:hypothetical protein